MRKRAAGRGEAHLGGAAAKGSACPQCPYGEQREAERQKMEQQKAEQPEMERQQAEQQEMVQRKER